MPAQAADFSLNKNDHVWLMKGHSKREGRSAFDHPLIMGLLRRYVAGNDFTLEKNEFGKPQIKSPGSKKVYLSLSHTKDLLSIAFSSSSELGIDLEEVKPRKMISRIAKRYFDPTEAQNDLWDFYRSWTAREAFVKALGASLFNKISAIKLDSIDGEFVVGSNDNFYHKIEFKHMFNRYVFALCRHKNTAKNVNYFYFPNVYSAVSYPG